MLKVRTAVTAFAVIAALSILPIATSQAGDSAKSASSEKEKKDSRTGERTNSRGEEKSDSQTADSGNAGGVGAVTYSKGGPIVAHPNSYVIWYGGWDPQSCNPARGGNSTASIINDLVKNIGDSPWNKINSTYYQNIKGERTFVSSSIKYSGCIVDSGSVGLSLDGATGPGVGDVVNHAIDAKLLPKDESGVYLVLTNLNVAVDGFLTSFCGYHSYTTNGTSDILYSFIGDPSASLGSCVSQLVQSPNDNPAADGMASVLAHELVEPISDPYFTSWFDQSGLENADKCSWRYGEVVQGVNGSFSNMELGGRKYLIQQNVAANTNKCVSSLEGHEGKGGGSKK